MLENVPFIEPEEPYQMWFSLGGEPFQLLLSQGSVPDSPPLSIPRTKGETAIQEHWHGTSLETWFFYPNNGYLVLRRSTPISLSERERQQIFALVYPYYAEKIIKKQHYILEKMAESIRAISSILDLDELLLHILKNSMEVISCADMGVLWMYDGEFDALTARTAVGQISEATPFMRMRIGEGIIGMTYLDGKPRLLADEQAIAEIITTISTENANYLMRALYDANIQSIVSAPITVEGSTECVLIIYQSGKYPLLTEYDQQLLQSFADQVSIAITNARLFQNLYYQNNLLVKRDEIYATLMQLKLQNKGVDRIIKEMEKMLRLPLVFIDLLELEYSPRSQQWQNTFHIDELKKQFGTLRAPIYHTFQNANNTQLCYIYPLVVAMNVCLGLLIVDVQMPLTSIDQLVLEQGGTILTLEMVHKQSLADFYYKKTSELFNDLLHQKDGSIVRKRGEELGLQDRQVLMATIFEVFQVTDMQQMNLQVHRLVNAIKQTFGQRACVVFGCRNKVTMLLELAKPGQYEYALQQCRLFTQKWEKEGGAALRSGAGSDYQGLMTVAKSYNEAEKALAYQASRHASGLVSYAEIGINRLFIHQSKEEIVAFLQEVFEPLRFHEGSQLEETLQVYISYNQSVKQTALALHIHTNTLYQRLRKIEDILGLSLHNPKSLLKLQLACYLRGSYEEQT